MSLRDIANELREPFHRVRYAVAEGGIKPAMRIGIVRLFDREQLPVIKAALEQSSKRQLCHV